MTAPAAGKAERERDTGVARLTAEVMIEWKAHG